MSTDHQNDRPTAGMFRDRVRERDLDNFLVEELHASNEFISWFLKVLGGALDPPMGDAAIQKSPPREQDRRQTDVRIGWFDPLGEMTSCVLIESKVTADFMPGQAEAYAGELTALRVRLGHRHAAAVLVAPSAKMPSLAHDGAFDAEITIEDIVGFLNQRRSDDLPRELDARLEARVELLEALCGKRSGSGWIGGTVQEKRDFAQAYAELAAELLPDLRVRPSTDGPKAITRIFEGLDLPGLPRATLRHEFGAGVEWKYANILFAGVADRLPALRAAALLQGTPNTAESAGKSLALRVRTPGVNPMSSFDEERDAVVTGLSAIRQLVDWITANRAGLAVIIPSEATRPDGEPAPGGSPRSSIEKEFAAALRETYRQCELLGYQPTGLLGMIDQHGGIETARRLLAKPAAEGLARLVILGRRDLSIEAIVLDERWRDVFSEAERTIARRRLR